MKFWYIYVKKCTKYLHGTWSLLNILMIFAIKIDNFDPYNVFLAVATNIPQRFWSGFVVQGHILCWKTAVRHRFRREGIIFCFRMSQYMLNSMNRSSPVPAALMQPQTMMLPPPCMTVGKAQFVLELLTRASQHMLDTIWVKQVYLRLIRPQDMVPVIHALGQVVLANCLLAFLWASFSRGSRFKGFIICHIINYTGYN